MADIQFVTWDGGGNLPPTVGIAQELRRRGHAVRVIGEESQRHAVDSAGLSFTAWSHPLSTGLGGRPPSERLTYLIEEVWLNANLADEVIAALALQPAEIVVVDCMLEGVLACSQKIAAPTVVLVHGLFRSVLPVRDSLIAFGNQLREAAGPAALDLRQLMWEHKDLVVVTTLREFDGADDEPATNIRYVGPVLPGPSPTMGWPSPWEASDQRPLVLVSLSTMPGQGSFPLAQKVLDALAESALRVVMTTGALPPETLTPPENAAVFGVVPHEAILPEASLMVTHGGHGSVMGALAHGLPLVCIPGVGADQPIGGRAYRGSRCRKGGGSRCTRGPWPHRRRGSQRPLVPCGGSADASTDQHVERSRRGSIGYRVDARQQVAASRGRLGGQSLLWCRRNHRPRLRGQGPLR